MRATKRARGDPASATASHLLRAVSEAGGSLIDADVRDAHPLPGLGLFALRDLSAGDTLATIPGVCILSVEAALASVVGKAVTANLRVVCDAVLDSEAESGAIPQRAVLLLYLVACRHHRRELSPLPAAQVAYAKSLPAETGLPVTWSEHERRQLLAGTDLERKVAHTLAELQRQYDVLFPALTVMHPQLFPAEIFTRDAFVWAHTIISSRAFPHSCLSGGAASDDARDAAACGVLIPVLDIANHSPGGADIRWDPDTCSVIMTRPVKQGAQIWSSYGAKSTCTWLLDYGFVLEGNEEHDCVAIRIAAILPDSSQKTRAQKMKLFAQLAEGKASLEVTLTHAAPLPDIMLEAATVCRLTAAEAAAYSTRTASVSASTRAAALAMLQQLLERRIAAIIAGVGHSEQLKAAQEQGSLAVSPQAMSAVYRAACVRLLRRAQAALLDVD